MSKLVDDTSIGTNRSGTLSAIWILSCNDENSLMTYKGISHRLGLSNTEDARALVMAHPELFRPGVPRVRFESWKADMRSAKHRPSWLLDIGDREQRNKEIESLTRNDVFRSQFRVEDNAPKSDLTVLDWGLAHIERLEKAATQTKEERTKKWTAVIIPLASILVALASVIGSVVVQRFSSRDQFDIKRYEVAFKPKQEGYSTFMASLNDATLAALNDHDEKKLLFHLNKMEAAFFAVEPFLETPIRGELDAKFREFIKFCYLALEGKAFASGVDPFKEYFRTALFNSLFTHS